MICERCGKEVKVVEVKYTGDRCERLCKECADNTKPPETGEIFVHSNGSCVMSIGTLRKLIGSTDIASAYIKLKEL